MNVSCPQCSGNNQVETPDAFVKCEFCKSSLFIDIDEITVVYSVAPIIDVNQLAMYLKRDFEKTGFNEKIEIADAAPVYFPFWQADPKSKQDKLTRGSSRFPGMEIAAPSGEKVYFNAGDVLEKGIEIVSIDTQPEVSKKRDLYYVPFFQARVNFNRRDFFFFINAVNGEVFGDPIPYISSDVTFKLFPLFIGVFLVFLAITSVFNNMLVVMPLCLAALFIAYQTALKRLEKEMIKGGETKNES